MGLSGVDAFVIHFSLSVFHLSVANLPGVIEYTSLLTAMDARRQAVAGIAAFLWPFNSEARYGEACVLLNQLWAASQAVQLLPCEVGSFIDIFLQDLLDGIRMVEAWMGWYEETLLAPLEFCTPEPDMAWMVRAPITCPGRLPGYVRQLQGMGEDLVDVAFTMESLSRDEFRQRLDEAAESLQVLLTKLENWPLLAYFRRELSSVSERIVNLPS